MAVSLLKIPSFVSVKAFISLFVSCVGLLQSGTSLFTRLPTDLMCYRSLLQSVIRRTAILFLRFWCHAFRSRNRLVTLYMSLDDKKKATSIKSTSSSLPSPKPRRHDYLSVIRRNTAEVFFSTLVSLLLSTPLIAR
jgi:hypothetical protein